jgi:hypothetical protein
LCTTFAKRGGGEKELTTKRPFLSSIGKSMTTHKRRRKKSIKGIATEGRLYQDGT